MCAPARRLGIKASFPATCHSLEVAAVCKWFYQFPINKIKFCLTFF